MKIMSKLYEKQSEVWLPITCFNVVPGKYEASSCGNIRRTADKYPIKQQILRNEFGVYNTVHLQTIYSGKGTKTFLTHRIIASTFYIGIPYHCSQVNHKDDNGLNNCIYNLEWTTPELNTMQIYKYNPMNHYNYSNLEIYNIYLMIKDGLSNEQILENLNLPNNYISMDFISRIRISYNNNLPEDYDFRNGGYNKSYYSIEQIHEMCSYIEQGKKYDEIAILMNIDITDKNKRRHFAAYIRQIRNKVTFTKISRHYNF